MPDEQVRLAKSDSPVEHLGRARDDEERLTVLFELGTLMRFQRILNGKFVQPKFGLELAQEVEAGLMQANPDHVPGFARPLADLLDGHLGHAPPSRIGH